MVPKLFVTAVNCRSLTQTTPSNRTPWSSAALHPQHHAPWRRSNLSNTIGVGKEIQFSEISDRVHKHTGYLSWREWKVRFRVPGIYFFTCPQPMNQCPMARLFIFQLHPLSAPPGCWETGSPPADGASNDGMSITFLQNLKETPVMLKVMLLQTKTDVFWSLYTLKWKWKIDFNAHNFPSEYVADFSCASNFPDGTSTVVVVVDVVDALPRRLTVGPVKATLKGHGIPSSSRKIEDDFQFSSV